MVSVAMVCLAFVLKALRLIHSTNLWSLEPYSVGKSFQPDFGALLAKKPLPLCMRYSLAVVVFAHFYDLFVIAAVIALLAALALIAYALANLLSSRSGR